LIVLLLPRCNHSFSPQILMALLHYCCTRRLFLSIRPFEAPPAKLSLARFFHHLCSTIGPVWPHPLSHATPSQWVNPLQVVTIFFQDPPLPWSLFLQLVAAPYGQMLVPVPILQCSDSFHCDLFLRDFWCSAIISFLQDLLLNSSPPLLQGKS
jgi:hypothetical protein